MDRTKIKDQFGQFGRRREYGADDDRTTSRQMKKSRRMCAAAAVLFAFAAAFALTTAVYRMDAKAQSDLQRRIIRRSASTFMFWQTATAGKIRR